MAAPVHTYGPTCALHDKDCDDCPADSPVPPKVKAQFFYISALPIDDPLSPLPPVSDSKTAQSNAPPQPFSVKDNNALEEAWQGIQAGERSRPSSSAQPPAARKLGEIFRFPRLGGDDQKPARRSFSRMEHFTPNVLVDSDDEDTGLAQSLKEASRKAMPAQELKEERDAAKRELKARKKMAKLNSKGEALQELRKEVETLGEQSREQAAGDSGPLSKDGLQKNDNIAKGSGTAKQDQVSATTSDNTLLQQRRLNPRKLEEKPSSSTLGSRSASKPRSVHETPDAPVTLEEDHPHGDYIDSRGLNLSAALEGLNTKKSHNPFRSISRERKAKNQDYTPTRSVQPIDGQTDGTLELSVATETNISGNPFARAPSYRRATVDSFDGASDKVDSPASQTGGQPSQDRLSGIQWRPYEASDQSKSRSTSRGKAPRQDQRRQDKAYVPVGIARLHLVEFPDMMMKPIYWNPVNDIAQVLRATWFYKNTMSPVEPDVANRLELGYEEMRPWTTTWQDELNSCVEHGADAELKITRRLWPDEDKIKPSRPGTSAEMKTTGTMDTEEPEAEELPENVENMAAAPASKSTKSQPAKLYQNHSIIYVDAKNAQILRPSLIPSPSRRRTPLSSIRKGRQIGIAVVRGFDRQAWDSLHPAKKMDARTANAKVGAYMSQSGDATTRGRRFSCTACMMQEKTPPVTDLVLVVHGIGQKLSERMDSYHFTHAINAFRRQVNIELVSEAVGGNVREEMGGIMVLPINWRLTVSFDDDGRPKKNDPTENDFSLKDITPDTLPAVRSLISDVMLDIPYYLSLHKDRMVSAVIKEANRVYRLWCRNNPGFHERGRVHVLAHSLGSAMALDILSQQPTTIPKSIDLTSKTNEKMFEFDTKSLFCCGSPGGFFLLLNRASLVPRKGRNKAGAEGEDEGRNIAGNAGTFGCLAVDNLYNVMHYNDPIAYHMNAAVDAEYAQMLKPAVIPSANPGWFSSMNNTFKWPSSTAPPSTGTRPSMNKLPSTVEMNIHDFTREEIAEQRMHLLNDNGQIDYFLNSSGGPLEIQYLNMLSAHSSYWTSQDFIRFIVTEVSRPDGRDGTIPVFRAEKKRVIKAGKIA